MASNRRFSFDTFSAPDFDWLFLDGIVAGDVYLPQLLRDYVIPRHTVTFSSQGCLVKMHPDTQPGLTVRSGTMIAQLDQAKTLHSILSGSLYSWDSTDDLSWFLTTRAILENGCFTAAGFINNKSTVVYGDVTSLGFSEIGVVRDMRYIKLGSSARLDPVHNGQPNQVVSLWIAADSTTSAAELHGPLRDGILIGAQVQLQNRHEGFLKEWIVGIRGTWTSRFGFHGLGGLIDQQGQRATIMGSWTRKAVNVGMLLSTSLKQNNDERFMAQIAAEIKETEQSMIKVAYDVVDGVSLTSVSRPLPQYQDVLISLTVYPAFMSKPGLGLRISMEPSTERQNFRIANEMNHSIDMSI